MFARAGMLRRLARDRVAAAAALLLTAIVLAALLAPWISPYDPYFTDLTKVMQPPGAEHWFGTDNTGRDILSRVIYGTRSTLMLGLVGVIVGGLFGGVMGILAAYYRAARRLDHAAGRRHAGVPGDPDRARGGGDLRRRALRRGDCAGRLPPCPTSRGWRAVPRSASWARNSWKPAARSACPTAR